MKKNYLLIDKPQKQAKVAIEIENLFALYWQVTKMAFVNPLFVKNPLIDKPRKSCFFALEMKNKKSAPRKERKNISSKIFACISTEK